MSIKFNEVTWYSKAAAVAVFVATFFLGFWLGIMKGESIVTEDTAVISPSVQSTNSALTLPIYFEAGDTVVAYGYVVEDVKKIDAPSYLMMRESRLSEDHLFKVFYAGDSCAYPTNNRFDVTASDKEQVIRGKAVNRFDITVCDAADNYVQEVPLETSSR